VDALFLAELNERLFVQFSQGLWRAPLGQRHLDVFPIDEARVGRIVCAEPADVTRAMSGLGQGHADPNHLQDVWLAERLTAMKLRAIEGFDDQAQSVAVPVLSGRDVISGPVVLLSAADTPLDAIVQVMLAGAELGVLWKPAPKAAASAHYVMRALGPLAGGNLAMVQGDHATGLAVAGQGRLIWASAQPVPEELGTPALKLSARVPRRQ